MNTATVHFIDGDWSLRTGVLETASFPGSHTGVRIAERMKETATLSPENVDALVFLHRNTSYQWQSVASPDVVVKPEEQHNEAPALPVL